LPAGYFDAFGNYIEYQFEGLRDAWLDSLDVSGALLRVQACFYQANARIRFKVEEELNHC